MTPFLTYILRSAAALAVFYAIYELLLKKETFFHLNRIYLVSGLLLSLLIPAFPIISPFRTILLVPGPGAPEASKIVGSAFGPADILPYLYWAGAAALLGRLALQLARLGLLVRRNGVRRLRGLKIVPVDPGSPPFSFFDVVFLDEGLSRAAGFRRILAHEAVHIRQQHTFDVLLMEIVLSLQWFNPFVWPYKKALQATHEYLADSGVIAQGFSSVKYQLLMFEQHMGASLFELGNNFKRSQIKRRIMMLSQVRSSKAARLKLLLTLPLVLALILAFAEPKAVAGSAVPQEKQEKVLASDPATQNILKAQEVAKKLGVMEMDIKAKIEETQDAAARTELKKKLETVLQKRHEVETFIAQSGGPIPPPPSPPPPPPALASMTQEELKAQYKMLAEKEADVQSRIEIATDETEKAKLAETLEKIHQKQAQVKEMAMAAGAQAGGPKIPATVEELEQGLAKLKAKEADIREKMKTATDPAEKIELKKMLEKALQTQEVYKVGLAYAKGAKTAKVEKIEK